MIGQTESWQKVTSFYRDITEKNPFFRPMMELAEQIAASKYACGLHPWTSMHTLCISQTPEADTDKEVLRISLDPRDRVLVYDFQETGSPGSGGVRRTTASHGLNDSFSSRNGSWITGRYLNDRNR
jgi:hypothetical protein